MHISARIFNLQSLIACATLVLLVTGCANGKSDSVPVADKWIGKWSGPEGTFLLLAGGRGKYEVTIHDLDGPRTFRGSAAGSQIVFERDGVNQFLRATNGADTGMKWLSEKSDCLTVRAGEGYCRD